MFLIRFARYRSIETRSFELERKIEIYEGIAHNSGKNVIPTNSDRSYCETCATIQRSLEAKLELFRVRSRIRLESLLLFKGYKLSTRIFERTPRNRKTLGIRYHCEWPRNRELDVDHFQVMLDIDYPKVEWSCCESLLKNVGNPLRLSIHTLFPPQKLVFQYRETP